MVPSPSLGKLLAWDRMIKAAIMRRGFICSSSIGTTNGPDRHITTETSVWKNVLKNVTSVKYWATFRSHRNCATTCAPWFLWFHLLIITKWPDQLSRLRQIAHVRRISISSILEFSMCHFPSRTPCASCTLSQKKKLYNSSVAVMLREMQREVNMDRPFESRLQIDYTTNKHGISLGKTAWTQNYEKTLKELVSKGSEVMLRETARKSCPDRKILAIRWLHLKTTKFINPDESWSFRTKISRYDPQIYPGTLLFSWLFVSCP